ncbi:MAG: bifunctional 2-C-methyl-D-erythritol 4-phosphate cytidylyltransferase/2-C-methyl-D-erythritol 2,4-cyclodiphosphate synthase [Amaricoccus sp.]|uniref:bifunctional 2-C-methyl-D-erythritol 4-phosphate cytidylyltransferase/2-C-methyl-D-erythritol 2,4-cyclodiphosphate synthase n=1 Tax=Amaricoccus sp. TaxID=1872485 RepID=UPI0039E413E3
MSTRAAGLIVAAGRGERLGGTVPKQYLAVGGQTMLRRSVEALLAVEGLDAVLVVIHPDDAGRYAEALTGLTNARLLAPVAGGADRPASVRAGLEALVPRAPEKVLIHDAARPFLPAAVANAVLAALDTAPAAFPALPVVDALWRVEAGGADAPVPRDGLWRAQTPQGFHFAAILAAHRTDTTPGGALDDVAVARAAGLAARVVPGSEANFKITTPEDLARADRLARTAMDIRTGNGFDVHAFGPGDGVTLCGVRLPFDRGLVGHSDADVGMHALTDAILGALAEGDIGRWFPPSDPQWKGAASEIFLAAAVARLAERGFVLTHADVTLVCEAPKIGPHAAAMRAELARICGVDPGRISVKATTSERLGFTGRGEGIAALATATLVQS